jgi:phage-related baseplate assembly protein
MASSTDSFTGVDLSRLPAPDVIEALDFETLRAAWIADFQAKFPAFDATVESDPIVKLCEVGAYRELVLRQRVNDAARAVMVAYARGGDLDALGALFQVERYIVTPADPGTGTPAVLESDEDFRRRIVLAPEGYSVAGPSGAYIFHALGASADVADASATSPSPGEVVVTILARSGGGTPSEGLLDTVEAALTASTVRPLTDHVTVAAAELLEFTVEATITFRAGPDKSVVLAAAQAALADYLAVSRRLGRSVTRAGVIAALFASGVQNVDLTEPADDMVPTALQVSICTGITIIDGGTAS